MTPISAGLKISSGQWRREMGNGKKIVCLAQRSLKSKGGVHVCISMTSFCANITVTTVNRRHVFFPWGGHWRWRGDFLIMINNNHRRHKFWNHHYQHQTHNESREEETSLTKRKRGETEVVEEKVGVVYQFKVCPYPDPVTSSQGHGSSGASKKSSMQ